MPRYGKEAKGFWSSEYSGSLAIPVFGLLAIAFLVGISDGRMSGWDAAEGVAALLTGGLYMRHVMRKGVTQH